MAKCTGEEERIEQDIDISIHGIGVSLVNNDENVRKELAYLSVSSSNIGNNIGLHLNLLVFNFENLCVFIPVFLLVTDSLSG